MVLSGPYCSVFDTMLPDVTRVGDPFHVVNLVNAKLDETRGRVQNETGRHRGRKDDPLYRIRRLLTRADERYGDRGRTRLVGLLKAGDTNREVTTAWQAEEAIRQIYIHTDPAFAVEHVQRLGRDHHHAANPSEVRLLGCTLIRWRNQIAAWRKAHVSNSPSGAANNLIKRVAFGSTRFRNYRILVLPHEGNPTGTYSPPSLPAEIRRVTN